jgi:hypothetical protein
MPQARSSGPLFFDVDTTGRQGPRHREHRDRIFRGIPTAPTRPAEPFHAAKAGVDRHAQLSRLRSDLAADDVGYRSDYSQMIMGPPRRLRWLGEDCLSLNVWTPGVNDNRSARCSCRSSGWATGSATGRWRRPARVARGRGGHHRQSPAGEFRLHHLARCRRTRRIRSAGVWRRLDMVSSLEWVRDNSPRSAAIRRA